MNLITRDCRVRVSRCRWFWNTIKKANQTMYEDNQHKWVAVLNKKVPLPQQLNALGHLAIGI